MKERDDGKGPFDSPGVFRRVAPFALAGLVGTATLVIETGVEDAVFAAFCLFALILAAAFWLPWGRLPAWAQASPPLAFFAVFILEQEAAGGRGTGLTAMALLPIVWLALHGSRAQLCAAIGGLTATFLVPTIFDGDVSTQDWRAAIMWPLIGAIVGFTVQKLVNGLDAGQERAQRQLDAMVSVTTILRTVNGEGAREEVCAGAAAVARAAFAVLLEPNDDETALELTAQAGATLPPMQMVVGGEPSGTVRAYQSRQRIFVANAREDKTISQRMIELLGAESVVFEPILAENGVAGVLVIGWRESVSDLPVEQDVAIRLFAAEAGSVLERADLVGRLNRLALHDELTGLPNRRAWEERSAQEFARSGRTGEPLTLALIDLDRFKAYNDRNGHQAGDQLLERAALAWTRAIRDTDTLARFGGDEFGVILPACPVPEARIVIERMRGATPAGQTCSIGFAQWNGSEDLSELIERTDQALYEAKRSGRDRTSEASGPVKALSPAPRS